MPELIKATGCKRRALGTCRPDWHYFAPAFGSERDLGISLVFYTETAEQAEFLEKAISAEVSQHSVFTIRS